MNQRLNKSSNIIKKWKIKMKCMIVRLIKIRTIKKRIKNNKLKKQKQKMKKWIIIIWNKNIIKEIKLKTIKIFKQITNINNKVNNKNNYLTKFSLNNKSPKTNH